MSYRDLPRPEEPDPRRRGRAGASRGGLPRGGAGGGHRRAPDTGRSERSGGYGRPAAGLWGNGARRSEDGNGWRQGSGGDGYGGYWGRGRRRDGPGSGARRQGRGDRGYRDQGGQSGERPWRRDAGGRPGSSQVRPGSSWQRGDSGDRWDDWSRPGGPRGRSTSRMEPGGQYRARARFGGLAAWLPFLDRLPGGGPGGRDGGGPGGRRPGRPRRKGDWWRRWTWKKALGVAAASFGGCAVIGSITVGVAYAQTKVPSERQLATQSNAASTVYFSNGKPIGTFGQTQHVILSYSQIPAIMRQAAIAAEDKNFYHEGGVSIGGIIRAAYYDLTSSGGNLQGASTITEQLVKQAYQGLSTQATNGSTLSSGVGNKIKEIFVAQKLAQEKSKAWIITEYLNTVYFGRGATGVGAAAEAYFGIHASQLNAAQAAMLAAMIQQPSYYSTPAGHQALVTRWRTHVLATMVQMGGLTAQDAAKLQFPKTIPQNNDSWNGWHGYLMQRVQYELATDYFHVSMQKAFDLASTEGLKIYTAYNARLMRSLYSTVQHNRKLMHDCAPPANSLIGGGNAVANGYKCTKLPPFAHIGAVLIQPGTGDILAEYGGPSYNHHNKYDYAMASYNQVGSSFKPYVLAAAVKQGMNAMNSIMNGYSPLWIPPVGSQPPVYPKPGPVTKPPRGTTSQWYPVINDEVVPNQGPVSVQKSMAESLNTAYTALYSRVGGDEVMKTAQEFGVDTGKGTGLWSNRDEVGEALGQGSLTVLEQATMIATLANNGTYVAPHAITKVVEGSKVVVAKVQTHQVLTQAQAAEVDWAMSRDTNAGGTAPGDGLTNGQVVIAKTGTTNLAQSGFFLGAMPKAAMAVGMFVDNPGCPPKEQKQCDAITSLQYAPPPGVNTLFGVGGLAGYGGGWPATIWHDFFMENFNNLPVQQWPVPPANLGQKWNLVGPIHHHKKHKPKPTASPTVICHGHRACQPSPSPSPSPTLPNPSPSPTCTSTWPNNKQSCPSPSPTTTAPTNPTSSPTTTVGMVVGDRRLSWTAVALL